MRRTGSRNWTLKLAIARVKSARRHGHHMIELLRSNDLVLLSYVRALLASEGIKGIGLDEYMSMVDGNIGAIPQRIMVDDADVKRAQLLLRDVGIGHVLKK